MRLRLFVLPGFVICALCAIALARQHAEKALAILASHKVPAASWSDTDEYRGEIRRGAEKVPKQLSEK